MPFDNFLVRAKRRLVEKYSDAAAWEQLGMPEQGELIREVAGLPSAQVDSDLDAKQFDLLMLSLQLAVLRIEPQFDALKESVIAIASALEEKQAIPMVRDQMLFIQEVQTTQFLEGVTLAELELVRVRLRALVKFIEKGRRTPVYTNFEDEMRGAEAVLLPGISVGVDTARFREKALAFLRDKLDDPALYKVRWNEPLTSDDIEALESNSAQTEELSSTAQVLSQQSQDLMQLVGSFKLGSDDRPAAATTFPIRTGAGFKPASAAVRGSGQALAAKKIVAVKLGFQSHEGKLRDAAPVAVEQSGKGSFEEF